MGSSMVWLLDILGILIVLKFWISPEQMGVAALVIPFFPALDLVSEMGLPSAVIQRDDHTPEKVSTVFWMNFGMSVLLLGVLSLIVGPLLAWIHDYPILAAMFTAYGFKLVWHNVYVMPRALMRRELRFKELEMIRTVANLAEFGAKVGSAAAGLGIWCFVLGPAARVFVVGIGVQIRNPWRPRFVLRLRESIEWAKFGLKASASQIIYHLYTNLDYQLIGVLFTREITGLYWAAYEMVLKPCHLIGQTLQPIAFAAFSRLKHERQKLIDQYISFTRLSLVVMFGFLTVILVSAEDILSFWDEDAVAAGVAARILCGVGVLRALSYVIPPLLNGMGRPGLSLLYNSVAAVIMPAAFFVSAYAFGDRLGYLAVAYAWAVGYPIAFSLLLWMALELLSLRAIDYTRRVIGIPMSAAVSIGASFAVHFGFVTASPWLRFTASTAAAVVVFGLVLAYWQGISPRSMIRAIRGQDRQDPAPPGKPA